MRTPEEVAAMLRLRALGWGQADRDRAGLRPRDGAALPAPRAAGHRTGRRAARAAGRTGTVAWRSGLRAIAAMPTWCARIWRELGITVSLRTVERAVAPPAPRARGGSAGDGALRDAAGRAAADRLRRARRCGSASETVRVHLFVATLGYSRRVYVRAFRHERQSAWLDGIEGAFRHFGGVPRELLLDNAKALVDHHDARRAR